MSETNTEQDPEKIFPSSDDQSPPMLQLKIKLIDHIGFLKNKPGGRKLLLAEEKWTRIIIENFKFDQAEFASTVFSFSSFAGSSFNRAKLVSTKFNYCNLVNCDFSNAQMRGLSIANSNADHGRFSRAQAAESFIRFSVDGDYSFEFRKTKPETPIQDFSNSNFQGADLTGADLRNCKMQNVNLVDADLTNANLQGADLGGANLVGAKLTGTNLVGVNLSGASFSINLETQAALGHHPEFQNYIKKRESVTAALSAHETWVRSDGRAGSKVSFADQNLKGFDFRFRTLAAIQFLRSNISACLFTETVLAASSFQSAKVGYSNFVGVDARGASFEDAEFRFCTFEGANFADLMLEPNNNRLETAFKGAVFINCQFAGAVLPAKGHAAAQFIQCQF